MLEYLNVSVSGHFLNRFVRDQLESIRVIWISFKWVMFLFHWTHSRNKWNCSLASFVVISLIEGRNPKAIRLVISIFVSISSKSLGSVFQVHDILVITIPKPGKILSQLCISRIHLTFGKLPTLSFQDKY